MVQTLRVICPDCGKSHIAYDGDPAVDCNCNSYCEDGSKPSDCTLVSAEHASVPDRWRGRWNWPQGMHLGRAKETDDVRARRFYCSTHNKFISKPAVTINVDWNVLRGHNRINKKRRFDRAV